MIGVSSLLVSQSEGAEGCPLLVTGGQETVYIFSFPPKYGHFWFQEADTSAAEMHSRNTALRSVWLKTEYFFYL